MRPVSRRLLAALGLSVLLHLYATHGIDWRSPAAIEVAPPIEARMERLAAPQALQPPPARAPRPRVTASPVTAPLAPQTEPEPPAPEAAKPEVAAFEEPKEQAVSAPSPSAEPYAHLPERFGQRFRLWLAGDGLELGRVVHLWQREGERYRLTATAEPEGLAALIAAGRFEQSSEGLLTPAGLRPERFVLQRGARHFQAVFDWAGGHIDFGSRYGTAALAEGTQDILSLAYQLAFFPRPADGSRFAVAHGKRVQTYVYQELGAVELALPAGPVPALHLRLSQGEADVVELWLRREPPHLPLKLSVSDGRRGEGGVLVVEDLP